MASLIHLDFQARTEKSKVNGKMDSVDYWEVDPDWDGETFQSKAQAVRPVRTGDIAHELKIKTGRKVCIRLVMASGIQYQSELNV